jgi:hypothetical protein
MDCYWTVALGVGGGVMFGKETALFSDEVGFLHTCSCINTQQSIKHKNLYYVFIILLRQRVSILIESSSGPSKVQILTYKCLKWLWDPKRLHSLYNYVKNARVVLFLLYNQDTCF